MSENLAHTNPAQDQEVYLDTTSTSVDKGIDSDECDTDYERDNECRCD